MPQHLLIMASVFLVPVFAQRPTKQSFSPGCSNPSYPVPAPVKPPGIDAKCGIMGTGTTEANQNRAKNNFCATGEAEQLVIADFARLQAQVEKNPGIPFGDVPSGTRPKGPAVDRAPLQKLGEGKLVVMQGYVFAAKQEGAETVNCASNVPNLPSYHDIHIAVVDSAPQTDECSGIVTEMIPHHRPDAWKPANIDKVRQAKARVRITGQLFFDSSHVPCQNGQGVRDNPKRISLWEIHPVYNFEVCTADCANGGQWLRLDEWLKAGPPTSPQ
jgi:hypothetical protein